MRSEKGAGRTRKSSAQIPTASPITIGAEYELSIDGDEDTFVRAKVLPHVVEVSVCGDHRVVGARTGRYDREANIAFSVPPNGQFSVIKHGRVLKTYQVPEDHQAQYLQPVALAG